MTKTYFRHLFTVDVKVNNNTRRNLICLFALFFLSASVYASNSWTLVGDLQVPRDYHSATTFSSTRVLVSGGISAGAVQNSAEVFEQSTGVWQITGSMSQARQQHAAVLLNDGRILVAGGLGVSSELSSVEIYDPTTASWSNAASMNNPRASALISKLQDGRVLLSGGSAAGINLTNAEIYDPSADTWTLTSAMVADTAHTNAAVLLNDGRVFIKGHAGYTNSPFVDIPPGDPYYPEESPTKLPQLFDPTTNTWTAASPMITPKLGGTSIALNDGRVLVVGGDTFGGDSWGYPIFYCNAPAEIYDPNTDTWTQTGIQATPGLSPSKVALLPDGKVLSFGPSIYLNLYSACGADNGRTDVYDPVTGTWMATDTTSANHGRGGAFAALVDGKVLSIGGGTFAEIVEIYTPTGPAPELPPRSEFLHISDIDASGVENNNYPFFTWVVTASFTVQDELGQAVEGATVSSVKYASQVNPDTCTTNAQGQCSLQFTSSNPDEDISVTDISKSLMVYDPASNADPDTDSDGTTILIQRPGAPDPWIYVSDLDASSAKSGRRWRATVTINVVNWNGDPEYLTEIRGTWSGGATGTGSCVTDINGSCQITSNRISRRTSSATFSVSDVIDNTFVYDPSRNTDPDGDSDGTSITVSKP